MAKRFTDTEKWKKHFIRGLSASYKLLWFYITDECTAAGIWEVDIEVAQIKLGVKLKHEDAIKHFGDKIVTIDNGTKWFIPSFIEFQYGELRDNNKPHVAIIKTLERYGLLDFVNIGYSTPVNNNIKGDKRLKVFARDNYSCTYCGGKFEVTDLQPDHIVPLNKNGTNDFDNVVTSCKTCNRKKSDLDMEIFAEKNGFDIKEILRRIDTARGIHTPTVGVLDMDMDKELGNGEGNGEGKGEAPKGNFIVKPFESPEFQELWNGWKEYRKGQHDFQYKSPHTEQAALKELTELAGFNEGIATKIIQQSISNGWKGFFQLRANEQGTTKNGQQQAGGRNLAYKEQLAKRMAGDGGIAFDEPYTGT